MKNPRPVNPQTSAEVREQGWQAESRDADGHLISCHAPIEADDPGIAEWIVECTSRGETVTFWPTTDKVATTQPPPPQTHAAGLGNGAGHAKKPANQKHCDGKAADDHTESEPDQLEDGVARSPREEKQHRQTDYKSSDSESHELSPRSHDRLIRKTKAFDQIVAARAAHVGAVNTYNERLIFVRSERERGNHSMRLDDEYEAMSAAHAVWHRTCQELADDALADTEGSDNG